MTLNISDVTSRFQIVAWYIILNTRTPLPPGHFSCVFEPPNYRASHIVDTDVPLVITNKPVAKRRLRWPSFLRNVAKFHDRILHVINVAPNAKLCTAAVLKLLGGYWTPCMYCMCCDLGWRDMQKGAGKFVGGRHTDMIPHARRHVLNK
jgi:hypothetical protein